MTASSQPDRAAPGATSDSASASPSPAASADEPSIGDLVKDASDSVSAIIRGEIALAKLELTTSAKRGGAGAALFIGAVVLLFFSLTFGLIALAEGLIEIGLSRWLGYLVVFGGLLVIIAILVLIGIRLMKRIKGPEKTIAAGKDTVSYLKSRPKSVS